MKGQATIDNEAGQRKLAIKKKPINGQIALCQDSPMNKAVDHDKIESLS
jgi:hypothetical protein